MMHLDTGKDGAKGVGLTDRWPTVWVPSQRSSTWGRSQPIASGPGELGRPRKLDN